MVQSGLAAAIAAVQEDFAAEIVDAQDSLTEALQLRYQVYCLERGFEPGADGLETDEFDAVSRHILLRHRTSREVIGTVRLVVPKLRSPGAVLPMEQVTSLPRLRQLPRERIAEVSRFALSKSRRVTSNCMSYLLRLALIRGIVQLSNQLGVDYWCALMEPKLLRLLQTSAIYFHQAGGLVDHHGFRQPSFVRLDEMLARVQREKPDIWEFLTDRGALWPEHDKARIRYIAA